MRKENKQLFIAFLFVLIITFIVFWNFFLRGLAPYSGNFMLAWYEPWKTQHTANGVITLAHKAVADDTFRQFLPFRLLATNNFQQLQLPLWNPYNGSGMPLLATMNVGFLNPFNLFFIFMPIHNAWSLHIITQFILLGIFVYLYCRSIGMQFMSSLFTMSTIMFSGFTIVRLIYGDYVYTFLGLPLLLYIVETFSKKPDSKKIFLLAPSVLFVLFSGAPQIILYVLITAICYAFLRIKNKRQLLYFFFQFFLGVGLSGIQLLPTFELYKNAAINPDSSSFIFDRFLLPFQHLTTLIIPNYFGNQSTYNYWGAADYIETTAAIGSIPCFFAVFYLLQKDKKIDPIKIFYFTIISISILSTIDWVGSRLLFSLPIPILSTGIPSRVFIITTFSIAILAGLGFEKLISHKFTVKQLFYRSLPTLILMSLIVFYTLFLFKTNSPCPDATSNISCRTVALRNTLIESTAFFAFIILFLFYILGKKNIKKLAQTGIVLLVVMIGIYNAHKFLPFSPKETFLPKNDLINILQEKTKDGRVFGIDEANIKTNFATLFRFYDPNYYDPLYIKRYGELIAYSKDKPTLRSDVEIDNSKTLSTDLLLKREEVLNLTSVKYLIFKKSQTLINKADDIIWQNDSWLIVKNNNALSHTFLVDDYEIISDDKKILEKLFSKSFDSKKTVIFEKPISFKIDKSNLNTREKIEIKDYQENKIILKSSTSKDHILVLTDNFYPGWKAHVDGTETEILRGNYTFRAILLPKGNHLIEFSYQPESLKHGMYTSVLSLVIYLTLICKPIFYKRP